MGGSKPYFRPVPSAGNPWTQGEDSLRAAVEPALADAMKSGTFNPFLANKLAKEERSLKAPPKLGETIPFFKFICDKFQATPVVEYIPSRNQVSPYYLQFEKQYCREACPDSLDLTTPPYQRPQRVLAGQCRQFQLQFIDLSPEIRNREDRGEHLYWNFDHHMRAKGYALVGNYIWESMKK